MIGTTLAHFRITGALGAGGMGEVAPSDPAGVFGVDYLALGGGGEGYACSYRRLLSTLFVIEGLK